MAGRSPRIGLVRLLALLDLPSRSRGLCDSRALVELGLYQAHATICASCFMLGATRSKVSRDYGWRGSCAAGDVTDVVVDPSAVLARCRDDTPASSCSITGSILAFTPCHFIIEYPPFPLK